MNDRTNSNSSNRITITLDRGVYEHIKQYGKFGESFSQAIERILQEKEKRELPDGEAAN